MKERPILFSGSMVTAILEGRKTMTRRVVKMPKWIENLGGDLSAAFPDKAYGVTPCLQVPCNPSDGDESVQRLRNPWMWPEPSRLWVRERWRVASINAASSAQFYTVQFADNGVLPHPQPNQHLFAPLIANDGLEGDGTVFGKWRPSIHMPRWASRITLEITGVRVERLQSISEEDAKAEGVKVIFDTHRLLRFADLWDKINGKKHPWSSNPWVWCISFKKL